MREWQVAAQRVCPRHRAICGEISKWRFSNYDKNGPIRADDMVKLLFLQLQPDHPSAWQSARQKGRAVTLDQAFLSRFSACSN
jgi:hypothetical protein